MARKQKMRRRSSSDIKGFIKDYSSKWPISDIQQDPLIRNWDESILINS